CRNCRARGRGPKSECSISLSLHVDRVRIRQAPGPERSRNFLQEGSAERPIPQPRTVCGAAEGRGQSRAARRSSLLVLRPGLKGRGPLLAQQPAIRQGAVGGVPTVTMSIDFTATPVSTEAVQDANKEPGPRLPLDLKAGDGVATYARIEYWVEQG